MMKKAGFLLIILFVFLALGIPARAFSNDVIIIIEENEYDFKPSPFIREGRTMVPMRSFFELMGAEIEWCNDKRAAFGYGEDMDIMISKERAFLIINGEKEPADVPSELKNGRLFIPLRFTAEFFDCDVNWDAEQRAVLLNLNDEMLSEQLKINHEKIVGNEEASRETGKEQDNKEAAFDEQSAGEENSLDKETASSAPEPAENFIWPVDGGHVVSEYGMRGGRLHYGLDIGAPEGTPILASDSGEVVISECEGAGGYGYSVVIKHGEYYTRYAHNSKNLVSVGDFVEQGDIIAEIGTTGNATCPHVHFEIRFGCKLGGNTDSHRDPLNYISPQ